MADMETQITNTDDYNYRVDEDPITIGCYNRRDAHLHAREGRYPPHAQRHPADAQGVCVHPGRPDDRDRFINDDAGTFRLAVRLGGRNRLVSFDDADGVKSVPGRYRGEAVNQRR